MTESPLTVSPLLQVGPVVITEPVLATWAIMAVVTIISVVVSRRLSLAPGKMQTALELLVDTIDQQIRDTMQAEPGPYRALIGTLFVFVLIANW